jgi:hypothetical protein
MPPAPTPTIEIASASQPETEPDLAQAPVRDRTLPEQTLPDQTLSEQPPPDQSDTPLRRGGVGEKNRSSNGDADREADRANEGASSHGRGGDDGYRRRLPDSIKRRDTNRDQADRNGRNGDDDNDSAVIGPKLFQWSGRVNQEREITIEMPGVPGSVEIPRAYRDRVGIVEPPNANNHWRCAVLRVFGRGGVSIVVRWWPAARNLARVTARR